MKMLTKTEERDESILALRERLAVGQKVYYHVEHVSDSGMSRRINFYIVEGGEIWSITWRMGKALGYRVDGDNGLTIRGCGMDMGYHCIYRLGRLLFPAGFGIAGKGPHGHDFRPASADMAAKQVAAGVAFPRRNGDSTGWDNDGGYALSYQQL